jgi:SAM-dependent methyltransferase
MTTVSAGRVYQNPKCFICGGLSEFICKEGLTIRESACPKCGGLRRNSDLARIIIHTFSQNETLSLSRANPFLKHLRIFEAQASGPLHNVLKDLPHYICSEYFDNIPNGTRNLEGILCENLHYLSFPDETFDLVITQDVLEHVESPEKAFSEIKRVLKPGGYHIFTVPYHENKPTLRRVIVENEEKIYKYPQAFHGDPLREKGALVFTDFGSDMNTMIENLGFSFESIPCEKWYLPSEIPYITDEKEYQTYLNYITEGNMLKYFKYNSWVFRTRKSGICE